MMAKNTVIFLAVLATLQSPIFCQDAKYWNMDARERINRANNVVLNMGRAKNVILVIGDGMDITTTTAARIRKGQLNGQSGEEYSLKWESFPHVALSKTYNTDFQVPDSAGTATAYLTGVKTKMGVIGMDDRGAYKNCGSYGGGGQSKSFIMHANEAGKATAVVTTTRITHATPASSYAHSPSRYWESDGKLPDEAVQNGCKDIALQLIENGEDINVIFGGGRREFTPDTENDPEEEKTGKRKDGRNLINEWIEKKEGENAKYVWNKEQFDSLSNDMDHVLGLFASSHMHYESDRENDQAGEPSISEMVAKAITLLSKNENGFAMLVEGGRIDHSHHEGRAYDALSETIALEEAVRTIIDMVDTEETLVIVTADHGHVMSIQGYPSRGNPILGVNDYDWESEDGLPYTTLGYMNGPGGRQVNESFHTTGKRPNVSTVDTEAREYLQDALIPLYSLEETHGGQDVAIYAIGPKSHLFHAVQEQNYIAHVIRYAACLGEYEECDHINNAISVYCPLFMILLLALSLVVELI